MFGVVHKWRHAVFDNFWYPLSPSSRFFSNKVLVLLSQNPSYLLPPKAVTSFIDGLFILLDFEKLNYT
jgi:hypothetical protein